MRKELEAQGLLYAEIRFAPQLHTGQGLKQRQVIRAAVAGLEGEPEGGARCTECFRMRLSLTAQTARYYGFEWYCTTLSVSPYKDALRLNRLGEQYGQETHVRFLPSDFKKKEGYKRSIELCRKYDIYRQDYCGCEFSLLPEKRQELEKKEEAERMLSEAGS